ncbi:MAG: hypothetical protein P8Y70_18260 [Candidatus Lokiarchaeota archaeon]
MGKGRGQRGKAKGPRCPSVVAGFWLLVNKNMKEIIESNLQQVQIGENYSPYHTKLPKPEELAEKYPAVKKYLEDQKNKEEFEDMRKFL